MNDPLSSASNPIELEILTHSHILLSTIYIFAIICTADQEVVKTAARTATLSESHRIPNRFTLSGNPLILTFLQPRWCN